MKHRAAKDPDTPTEAASPASTNAEEARDRLIVVLVSTRNPLNIGAAARAMCNFGFQELRVVNAYSPAFREAKSAVGASALLKHAQEFQTLAEAIADCSLVVGTTAAHRRKIDQELKLLPDAAGLIRSRLQANVSGRVALLFGSEKRGLSNQDLSLCHWLLRIPTSHQCPSMNLGQAVAVCLFELSRNPTSQLTTVHSRDANAEELERVTASLADVLRLCGYSKPPWNSRAEEKLRRFVRSLSLTQSNVDVLQGMLHQMRWRMTNQ